MLKAQGQPVAIYSAYREYRKDAEGLGIPFIWKAEGAQRAAEEVDKILATMELEIGKE